MNKSLAYFVTWSDETNDREDPEYYQPELVELERSLQEAGAVPLRDVARLVNRSVDPATGESSLSYIDISSVSIDTGHVQAIALRPFEAPSRARKKVLTGDVIVSTVRPERNAVALIDDELDGAVCSTGFAVFRARTGIEPYLLFAFLKSSVFVAQAIRRSTASMYPAVSEELLMDVFVPRGILEHSAEIVRGLQDAHEYHAKFREQLSTVRAEVERFARGKHSR